jgi:hypothetical protein
MVPQNDAPYQPPTNGTHGTSPEDGYAPDEIARLTGTSDVTPWDELMPEQQLGYILRDARPDLWVKYPYLDTLAQLWPNDTLRALILEAWDGLRRKASILELAIQGYRHALTPALRTQALATIQPEALEWLWDLYVLRNKVTLVEGDPGRGKTYLVLAICAAITQGFCLPDQDGVVGPPDPAQAGNVLYITAEDGLADTIRPRADKLGADSERIFVVTLDDLFPDGQPAFTLGNLRPLEQAIRERQARLVVLDPIQAFIGAKVDIHKTNEVRPLMTALAAMSARCGCGCIAMRHWTKGTGTKALYRGQASIDFSATARSVLVVGTSPENAAHRIMAQGKTNLVGEAKSIVFTITDTGLEWCGTSTLTADELAMAQPERQRSKQRVEAMAWLRDTLQSGPQPSKAVEAAAEAVGITPKVLERAKARACVESFKQGPIWYWRLPTLRRWADYDDDVPFS